MESLLISRINKLRSLAFLLILLFSFESQAQVAGISTSTPFEHRLNKLVEPNQQSNTANKPIKKSTKKISRKTKKSKKKSSKSAKKNTKKAKKSKKKASAKKASAKKASAKKANSSKKPSATNKNGNPPSALNIDPLRDLGIDKGYVCFRVKAYTNTEVSIFSKAACKYIKNSKKFRLTWVPSSNSVIGYRVYFGTSAKITNNFIADVI